MPGFDKLCRTTSARVAIGAAVLCAGIPVSTAVAQPSPQPGTGSPTSQTSLAGQVELARLIDLASEKLKLNIEYDAAVLKGTVTLRLAGGLSDQELWALVNRALAARGFTTVRLSGDQAYSVVKLSDAPGITSIQDARPGVEPEAGYQTLILQAKHRPAKELMEAIKTALSKPGIGAAGGAGVAEIGVGGLILVSDLGPRLEQASRIVELLDVPDAGTTIQELPTRNLSPVSLAALVSQVAIKREGVSGERVPGEVLASPGGTSVFLICPAERLEYWRGLIAQLDQREAVETITYTPEHFSVREISRLVEQVARDAPAAGGGGAGQPGALPLADDRWRMVVDDLTGSLVITATPSQHGKVRTLLERLASVPAAARRPVRTFTIKNRPVRELTSVLAELMRAGVLHASAEAAGAPGGDTTTTRPIQGVDSPPSSPVPLSAATPPPIGAGSPLIPSGTAAQSSTSRSGIGKPSSAGVFSPAASSRPLQVQEPGLVLTADEATSTLIAIGEPRLLDQLAGLIKTLDVRQPQVMLEVLLLSLSDSEALSLGVELTKTVDLSGSATASLRSLFGLSTAGTNGAGRTVGDAAGFTGVVLAPGDFAAVIRALETLSDGRSLSKPRLLVNNNQQATFSSVLQQPVATVSATTTSTINSFGGTQDAGTTATIKPNIAEGDHLSLEYDVRLSSFSGAPPASGLPPPRQENRVQSTVTIPDNFTVVVGGLETLSDTHATTQIPFIGSLPLIGEAFKNRNNATSKARFFVFIHATVLRRQNFEDLKYLSEQDVARAGVDDSFPVVQPRVIR